MKRDSILILFLMVAHFLVASYASVHILGGIPHIPDSAVYYRQAVLLGQGQLYLANFTREPQYAYTLLGMFVKDGNAYFHYSHFWPALLAVPIKLGVAPYLNPLLSALSLLFVFLIGRKLFNKNVGLIASVVYCFSPFTILMAADFMTHTATQFLLLAGIYALLNYLEKGKAIAALLAGVFFGYAFNVRPLTAVGVVAPFVIFSLIWYRKQIFRRRTCWYLVGFLAMFSLFLLDNWIVMGDALKPIHPLSAGGWTMVSSSAFANGINIAESNIGFFPQILWYGIVAMIFVGFSTIPLFVERNKNDWLLVSVFVSLLIVYMFTNAMGLHGYGPRYIFEAVFVLFILVGRGTEWCLRNAAGKMKAIMIIFFVFLLLHNMAGLFKILPTYKNYNGIHSETVETLKHLRLNESIIIISHSWNWYEDGVTATLYDPEYKKTFFIKEEYQKMPTEILNEFPDKAVYVVVNRKKVITYGEYMALKGNTTLEK